MIEAISTLQEGGAAMGALFEALSDDEMTRPATIGGGDWSAKDLMGHIAFWEELAVRTLAEWRSGVRPEVESIFDAGMAGVDAANAGNLAETACLVLDEVRARARRTHDSLVAGIRGIGDDEWRAASTYPNPHSASLGELLGSVTGAPNRPFGHAFAHLPDLEGFVGSR